MSDPIIDQIILVLLVLLALSQSPVQAVAPTTGELDTTAIDRFVLNQMAAHRIPAVALAITHGNKIGYVQGYGAAATGEPATGHTQFRLASLSKSLTAVAVLQRVEAGQVNLDLPITHYLPDFALATPAAAAQITVRQLLNHTSGLADIGFASGLAQQQPTLVDRVASLRHARPVDSPGTAFHYFDPNYQILARLVEVVSGQPFDAYLERHIFAPLDMRDTVSAATSDAATQRAHRLAQGHIVVYGVPQAVSELSGFLGGSGGVVSSAYDMAHYLLAQSNNGQYADNCLLSAYSIELMQTPPSGIGSSYGIGWFVGEAQGTRTIEHNGILSTSYAEAVVLPDDGYSFVLLYNEYGLASSALAFPAMKQGMVALLTNHTPVQPRLTVPLLGFIVAALTALSVWLALRSLLRVPRWAAHAHTRPRWRSVPGILWAFAPGLMLLGLPQLLAHAMGRFF
jgi:CubicO group peptidase (beta-lactamase class C family)